jgi:hypothetical protein
MDIIAKKKGMKASVRLAFLKTTKKFKILERNSYEYRSRQEAKRRYKTIAAHI